MSIMSAPALDVRTSAIFVLYCSSSRPLGWKSTLSLRGVLSNSGITHRLIQSADSELLPPETELAAIVGEMLAAPVPQDVRVRAAGVAITAGRRGEPQVGRLFGMCGLSGGRVAAGGRKETI
ncbi:hypothetical protein [Nonomuraea jabiensis]|uniref:Uncharacterized protein n=1 Tax=Nonomuraea jabiensis TaxID=882448 RepID=A0A7W9LHD7_9ACTN|nr:hypothetical protein [Nonomuraea jabiensis]MBB5783793.1 hypothetical protein [Nonomuraea jabiensis]